MTSFLKVTVEAFLKVTVLGRLLSGTFVSVGTKWMSEVKLKEETHSSLIQTGVSSSLNLKLVGSRRSLINGRWSMSDGPWSMLGGY